MNVIIIKIWKLKMRIVCVDFGYISLCERVELRGINGFRRLCGAGISPSGAGNFADWLEAVWAPTRECVYVLFAFWLAGDIYENLGPDTWVCIHFIRILIGRWHIWKKNSFPSFFFFHHINKLTSSSIG